MAHNNIIVGKHTLESLSIGMYSDPFTIYREYIQNSSDAIDKAVDMKLITHEEAQIDIIVDSRKKLISIRDNGVGISKDRAEKVLGDIGNSEKDFESNRGFRGIGRLGGLGYSDKLQFITSYKGEPYKTIITWDCIRLKELLHPNNKEAEDIISVIKSVTKAEIKSEDINKHYFDVRLIDVNEQYDELLDEQSVMYYIATVAPIPFDAQKFTYAKQIKQHLISKGKPTEEYKIYINKHQKPIYKMYQSHVRTGHQEKNKQIDHIKEIKFFEGYSSSGDIEYIGWYAVTNFYGSVQDKYMRGIRIRKGNILIGNENTFSKFFSSEQDTSNPCFIGEVYIYDKDIIPNAKRDDFERNKEYKALFDKLREIADDLNRRYRRAMSRFNSAIKALDTNKKLLEEISKEIDEGGVTSDTRKEQLLKQKDNIEKTIELKSNELKKILVKVHDEEQKRKANKYIKETVNIKKEIVNVENRIINAEYATKNDLPTSYSKAERKIYQRIIKVLDEHFVNDKKAAEVLRIKIIAELSDKKK